MMIVATHKSIAVGGEVEDIMNLRQRRIARIQKEIALLESMDFRMMVKKLLIFGPLAFLLVIFVLLLAIGKFGLLPNTAGTIVIAAILAALSIWIFRYALAIPVVLAIMLFSLIVMEPIDGLDHLDLISKRKAKIDRAIEKRRALLAKLESQL